MAKQQSTKSDKDEAWAAYLESVHLDQLDLSEIQLDEAQPSTFWRWARLAALIATLVAMLWLPSTSWYQLHSDNQWALAALGALAAIFGLPIVGWLWFSTVRAIGAAAGRRSRPNLPQMPVIPAAVLRWSMLILGLGLGGTLLFAIPREAEWQGSGYSPSWFVAVGIALTAGILLGRWLIMQADAARPARQPTDPIVLPPWVKWVTLSILILGGLFASFGHHLLGNESESSGFAMAGVGFTVGILGAIWLARRFDELEHDIRSRQRRQ